MGEAALDQRKNLKAGGRDDAKGARKCRVQLRASTFTFTSIFEHKLRAVQGVPQVLSLLHQ